MWIDQYRMISDSIDILDGKIVNYGIKFEIIADLEANRFTVLQQCVEKLRDDFLTIKSNFGESIFISDIYKHLNEVPGVTDTVKVEIVNKTGGPYSSLNYDMRENLSLDGRFINVPDDTVMEVLFPDQDIVGVIK